ncbi:MAG TPA: hypothetical protein V6C65_04310 [Allocoleopsis sp.]
MTFSRQEVFSVAQSAIAFVEGRANPNSLTVDKSRILPDEKGRYTILANSWIAEITSNVFGVLPRATVVQAFSTGSPTGKVNGCWRYLKAGDVLRVIEPYVVITVTTGWAANDTIAFSMGGLSGTFTLNGANGVTPADVVEEAVAYINASPLFSPLFRATGDGANLYVYGKTETPHPISLTATTAGAGDATITGPGSPTALVPQTVVGTISTIGTDGTITLTGNASVGVPVGGHIGIPVIKVFGVFDIDLDMTRLDRYALSPTTEAHGTYEQLLSYCDDLLKNDFKSLNIATKF